MCSLYRCITLITNNARNINVSMYYFPHRFIGQSRLPNHSIIGILTQRKSFSNEVQQFATRKRFRGEKKEAPSIFPGFLLVIPILTFCLGTWQVKRRKWKLNLIEDLKTRIEQPPVPLPEDLNELNNMEYRQVVVKGTFDHSKELYVGPRTPIADGEGVSRGGTLSRDLSGQSGYHVITPFHLSDRNMTILVNRGWVPRNRKNPETRKQGQLSGELELVGLVRLNETRPSFMAHNQPERNSWFYRDLLSMAQVVGSEPVMLDARVSSTVPGGPIGGQTKVSLRNEHLSYILTWYSLSAVTGYFWYRLYILKKPLL